MEINLIYAKSLDNIIGFKDTKTELPWYIPEDLKRFKDLTSGNIVIMGRKTWESLPIKPLPNRINIVLSKSYIETSAKLISYKDTIVLNSFENALSLIDELEHISKIAKVFIIGGKEVIERSVKYTNNLYITQVYEEYKSDKYVYGPNIDLSKDWELLSASEMLTSKSGIRYSYLTYKKK